MKLRWHLGSWAVAVAVVGGLTAACGGSDGTSAFTGSADDGGAGDATTGGDAGSGGDAANANDTGSGGGGDGAATGDGATGSGGGGDGGVDLPDGAIAADGGTITGDDAGQGGGTTSSLPCGNAACVIPAETCCVYTTGQTSRAYLCVVGSTCPTNPFDAGQPPDNAALQCTSSANCPSGTVCCATTQNNHTVSSCETTCTGQNSGQLCDPNAASTGCAADAGTCQPGADLGLPGVYTCGGRPN